MKYPLPFTCCLMLYLGIIKVASFFNILLLLPIRLMLAIWKFRPKIRHTDKTEISEPHTEHTVMKKRQIEEDEMVRESSKRHKVTSEQTSESLRIRSFFRRIPRLKRHLSLKHESATSANVCEETSETASSDPRLDSEPASCSGLSGALNLEITSFDFSSLTSTCKTSVETTTIQNEDEEQDVFCVGEAKQPYEQPFEHYLIHGGMPQCMPEQYDGKTIKKYAKYQNRVLDELHDEEDLKKDYKLESNSEDSGSKHILHQCENESLTKQDESKVIPHQALSEAISDHVDSEVVLQQDSEVNTQILKSITITEAYESEDVGDHTVTTIIEKTESIDSPCKQEVEVIFEQPEFKISREPEIVTCVKHLERGDIVKHIDSATFVERPGITIKETSESKAISDHLSSEAVPQKAVNEDNTPLVKSSTITETSESKNVGEHTGTTIIEKPESIDIPGEQEVEVIFEQHEIKIPKEPEIVTIIEQLERVNFVKEPDSVTFLEHPEITIQEISESITVPGQSDCKTFSEQPQTKVLDNEGIMIHNQLHIQAFFEQPEASVPKNSECMTVPGQLDEAYPEQHEITITNYESITISDQLDRNDVSKQLDISVQDNESKTIPELHSDDVPAQTEITVQDNSESLTFLEQFDSKVFSEHPNSTVSENGRVSIQEQLAKEFYTEHAKVAVPENEGITILGKKDSGDFQKQPDISELDISSDCESITIQEKIDNLSFLQQPTITFPENDTIIEKPEIINISGQQEFRVISEESEIVTIEAQIESNDNIKQSESEAFEDQPEFTTKENLLANPRQLDRDDFPEKHQITVPRNTDILITAQLDCESFSGQPEITAPRKSEILTIQEQIESDACPKKPVIMVPDNKCITIPVQIDSEDVPEQLETTIPMSSEYTMLQVHIDSEGSQAEHNLKVPEIDSMIQGHLNRDAFSEPSEILVHENSESITIQGNLGSHSLHDQHVIVVLENETTIPEPFDGDSLPEQAKTTLQKNSEQLDIENIPEELKTITPVAEIITVTEMLEDSLHEHIEVTLNENEITTIQVQLDSESFSKQLKVTVPENENKTIPSLLDSDVHSTLLEIKVPEHPESTISDKYEITSVAKKLESGSIEEKPVSDYTTKQPIPEQPFFTILKNFEGMVAEELESDTVVELPSCAKAELQEFKSRTDQADFHGNSEQSFIGLSDEELEFENSLTASNLFRKTNENNSDEDDFSKYIEMITFASADRRALDIACVNVDVDCKETLQFGNGDTCVSSTDSLHLEVNAQNLYYLPIEKSEAQVILSSSNESGEYNKSLVEDVLITSQNETCKSSNKEESEIYQFNENISENSKAERCNMGSQLLSELSYSESPINTPYIIIDTDPADCGVGGPDYDSENSKEIMALLKSDESSSSLMESQSDKIIQNVHAIAQALSSASQLHEGNEIEFDIRFRGENNFAFNVSVTNENLHEEIRDVPPSYSSVCSESASKFYESVNYKVESYLMSSESTLETVEISDSGTPLTVETRGTPSIQITFSTPEKKSNEIQIQSSEDLDHIKSSHTVSTRDIPLIKITQPTPEKTSKIQIESTEDLDQVKSSQTIGIRDIPSIHITQPSPEKRNKDFQIQSTEDLDHIKSSHTDGTGDITLVQITQPTPEKASKEINIQSTEDLDHIKTSHTAGTAEMPLIQITQPTPEKASKEIKIQSTEDLVQVKSQHYACAGDIPSIQISNPTSEETTKAIQIEDTDDLDQVKCSLQDKSVMLDCNVLINVKEELEDYQSASMSETINDTLGENTNNLFSNVGTETILSLAAEESDKTDKATTGPVWRKKPKSKKRKGPKRK